MTTVTQNCIVVVATVVGSLLFMAGLNWIWPCQKRRTHNDLIGWQLTILGTTYAVILGFMLYTVWTAFGEAVVNVDLEADSLMNVYRLAAGLPEPQRTQLQTLVRDYADAVIHDDWPEMARSNPPEKSVKINEEMWRTVLSVRATSPAEQTAEDHAIAELSSLSQHRLIRLLQSSNRLPNALWGVLLVGGTLTIVSACLFGSESVQLQAIQVFSFSLLISLSLVAIADIHRPFQGVIHVSHYAFERVQKAMQTE